MKETYDLIAGIFGDAGTFVAAFAVVFFFAVTGLGKLFEIYRDINSTKLALEEQKLLQEIRKIQAETAIIIKNNNLSDMNFFEPTLAAGKSFDKRPFQEKLAQNLASRGPVGLSILQSLVAVLCILGGVALFIALLLLFFVIIDYSSDQSRNMIAAILTLTILGVTLLYQGLRAFGRHLLELSAFRYAATLVIAILCICLFFIYYYFLISGTITM